MSLSISKARTNKNSTVSASRSHETLLTIIKQSSRTNKISFILSYCVQYINTGIHCDKNYNLIIPSFPTKQKKKKKYRKSRFLPTLPYHHRSQEAISFTTGLHWRHRRANNTNIYLVNGLERDSPLLFPATMLYAKGVRKGTRPPASLLPVQPAVIVVIVTWNS